MIFSRIYFLEALAVNNARTGFFIFFLGDPHGLEGGQRRQDGATDPYRVFALRWSNDLDLQGSRGKSSDFLLHTISNASIHGGATRHDNVGEKILSDVNVTFHDGSVASLVDSSRFHTKEGRLEKGFRSTETFPM